MHATPCHEDKFLQQTSDVADQEMAGERPIPADGFPAKSDLKVQEADGTWGRFVRWFGSTRKGFHMADLHKTRHEPIKQLFEILDDTHAVMAGLEKPGHGMQPMAPQVDEDRRGIWFYAKRDSEMGSAIASQQPTRGRICAISPDHDYHACISGTMSEETDRSMIDAFWSPAVAAWFEDGKEDTNLIMLRFDASEADVWASSGSGIRFAWEIAKANVTDEEPDVGEKTHLVFPPVAPASQAAQ